MSTDVGNRLTERIRDFFDGTGLAGKAGAAFVLVTTDEDGTPRPCMLSAGEVLATGERALRFALWSGTRTGSNLARRTMCLFCFVHDGDVAYVYGRARRLSVPAEEQFDCFELVVDRVSVDEHSGMPVTSGICFEVTGSAKPGVLAEWRRQVELLRNAE